MTPTLSTITTKHEWEHLTAFFPEANFLQSWNWGVFHEQLGKTVVRLAVLDHDQPVALVQGTIEKARRGRYLSVAGGPLTRNTSLDTEHRSASHTVTAILGLQDFANQPALLTLMHELKRIALEEHCVFIRLRPQVILSEQVHHTLRQLGALPSPMHVTADLTLQLDLRQPLEEILQQMRKNTRYEVKRADKLGVRTVISQNPEDIRTMYEQQLFLAKKHGFVPFSYEFWSKQFAAFLADDQVCLIHAYQGDQILASAFIIFYNGEAVYHYGTSTPANDKQPGSYACQWAAIQEAQKRGCARYNFWGIAPQDQPQHRFAGVSVFKRGFGGTEVQYVPAHDIPLHWQYQITRNFELLRKKWRRL